MESYTVLGKKNTNMAEMLNRASIAQIFDTLNQLGRLPQNFDEAPLIRLLTHHSDRIRYLAIKNLAKLSKTELLEVFINVANTDNSSIVRREAVSAIGRLRNSASKPALLKYLNDKNPEIALQAIRGLLVFKKDGKVVSELKKLESHPNETIREIIYKEFNLLNNNYRLQSQTNSPDFIKNIVVHGDVQEILKYVPSESIHLTFTSPPYYNARDYAIYQSYQEYLDFLERVFKEVYRITKEGRFFVLNTSPIIIPRAGRQYSSKRYPIPYDIHPLLVKMGWEFIDDIVWVKPEASAKNRNAGFLQHRKPLAYKPNACTVMVYRKKSDKLLDWNIRQYPQETVEKSKINGDYESSNIWRIDPVFDKTHSAVFPSELCDKVIKFYSFEGDLIFDPFAGSGTLGKSAMHLNRFFFLTEKEAKYIDRIKENMSQTTIFRNEIPPKFTTVERFKVDSYDPNIN